MHNEDAESNEGVLTAAEEPPQPGHDWPERCVAKALELHQVPELAASALTQALQGAASERSLKNAELAALADKLIAGLEESPPGEDSPAGEVVS